MKKDSAAIVCPPFRPYCKLWTFSYKKLQNFGFLIGSPRRGVKRRGGREPHPSRLAARPMLRLLVPRLLGAPPSPPPPEPEATKLLLLLLSLSSAAEQLKTWRWYRGGGDGGRVWHCSVSDCSEVVFKHSWRGRSSCNKKDMVNICKGYSFRKWGIVNDVRDTASVKGSWSMERRSSDEENQLDGMQLL